MTLLDVVWMIQLTEVGMWNDDGLFDTLVDKDGRDVV